MLTVYKNEKKNVQNFSRSQGTSRTQQTHRVLLLTNTNVLFTHIDTTLKLNTLIEQGVLYESLVCGTFNCFIFNVLYLIVV